LIEFCNVCWRNVGYFVTKDPKVVTPPKNINYTSSSERKTTLVHAELYHFVKFPLKRTELPTEAQGPDAILFKLSLLSMD
jgi:hypothetical protein